MLVDGACQIPDPLYKLIGSIICFYIPLGVMLLTYALTVRLLAEQQQNIGGKGAGWSSGWLGAPQGAPQGASPATGSCILTYTSLFPHPGDSENRSLLNRTFTHLIFSTFSTPASRSIFISKIDLQINLFFIF